MNLWQTAKTRELERIPRVSGDEPYCNAIGRHNYMYSPRERG